MHYNESKIRELFKTKKTALLKEPFLTYLVDILSKDYLDKNSILDQY
jgi:hypothetical protein